MSMRRGFRARPSRNMTAGPEAQPSPLRASRKHVAEVGPALHTPQAVQVGEVDD